MQLITMSVRRAFTCSGVLKSMTPSEIASSPVNDEPPLAKARSNVKIAAKVSKPCSDPIGTAPSTLVLNCGKVPVMSR